jgi:NAD(P)H-hydrate epimerase
MTNNNKIKTVTAEEMRALDRRATEEYHLPSLLLMENAGRAVAENAADILEHAGEKSVTVLCGSGNNGGDGLVAARYLFNRGCEVKVLLPGPENGFTGDALLNLHIVQAMGIPVTTFAASLLKPAPALLIDALLGTGLKGPVRAPFIEAIESINAAGKPVLAVDIPSGLDADTGAVHGHAVRASVTVTMAMAKKGMIIPSAAPYVGRLVIADIGFPRLM